MFNVHLPLLCNYNLCTYEIKVATFSSFCQITCKTFIISLNHIQVNAGRCKTYRFLNKWLDLQITSIELADYCMAVPITRERKGLLL